MNKNGRPTNDKKGCILKLRLNEIMRCWVEQQAHYKGVSMSEYLRKLIERDMQN